MVGFAVLKASDSAAVNLRRQLGGTFNIEIDMGSTANMQANMQGTSSADQYTGSYYVGKYLDHTIIDEIMKNFGISEYSANIEVVANLKSDSGAYYNLLENPQNYYSSANSHIASIQGWTSLQQCPYFTSNILEVTKGTMFPSDKSEQAVISRELAEYNHIEVGDRLILEINRDVTGIDFPLEKQECVFEVVGIFDFLEKQQIDQYTSQRQMLQNWIFVDSGTLLPYLNELLESIGEQPIGYEKVTFHVNDPAEMDFIIEDILRNETINWNYFKIKIDNTNYRSAENSLKSMDDGIRIMILAITIVGTGILILLLSIWAKTRIHEIGILLSAGKTRYSILAQRIIEIALITGLAFGFSFVCSNIVADDVGNRMLMQANEQNTEETDTTSLHSQILTSGNNFDLNPVFAAPKVEELNIILSMDIFVTVYSFGLLIAFISICVVSIPVMKMKPKAILVKQE